MKINQITEYLESLAPSELQESYDNSGLIVGHPDQDIRKALICLDSTEEVVEEAIENDCNLIIAHHPIVFGGIKRLNGKNYVERTLIKAIKNEVAIYAIHTNLDHVMHGVNRTICDRLHLSNCRILRPKGNALKKVQIICDVATSDRIAGAIQSISDRAIKNYPVADFTTLGVKNFGSGNGSGPDAYSSMKLECVFPAHLDGEIRTALEGQRRYGDIAYDIIQLENIDPEVGSGMIGEVTSPVNESEFLAFVKKQFKTDCIRHTAMRRRKVSTVAVCGGSGSFLLQDAIASGADVFVSADFKYHQFFDADGKIVIADVGHYESEQFTKGLLCDLLMQKFPKFALLISNSYTNPIKYLI